MDFSRLVTERVELYYVQEGYRYLSFMAEPSGVICPLYVYSCNPEQKSTVLCIK